MPFSQALSKPTRLLLLIGLCFACPFVAAADEVVLKNGTRLQGSAAPLVGLGMGAKGGKSRGPTTVYNVTMVDTGLARYFVPRLQVAELEPDQLGTISDTFPLRQHRTSRSVSIGRIGQFVDVQPFDEWGRRKITLKVDDGKELDVYQAVTELTPTYLKLEGMNYLWESGIATTSLPPETLDAILRKTIKQDNSDQRMALVRYYLHAKMYRQAQNELEAIEADFPELEKNVGSIRVELTQLQARQLLDELNLRKEAGQHSLVYEGTLKFPTKNVSRSILREVGEITADYRKQKDRRDLFVAKLQELRGQIPDVGQASAIAAICDTILDELNIATMERLESFFLFTQDAGLPAEEQLGLALSGFVVGSTNADTNLNRALNLWKARELALEFMTADTPGSNRRTEIVEELKDLEGIDARSVANMLPLLPAADKSLESTAGQPFEIELPSTNETAPPVAYTVVLPPEYHVGHNYPMIVALRGQGRTTRQEAEWWAGNAEKQGQAQRHGYIVIAPQYTGADAFAHAYDANSHHIVIEAIHDACRRFQVDSDRIYLSGHTMGGDAAFDIGLSHPDLFAGVIPICGVVRNNCLHYWRNAKHLPFYVVGGEMDRNTLEENAPTLMRMMRYAYDLIYVEYVGRGCEGFYEEIHKLFAWMERHQRTKSISDIEMQTMRETDGRFYWFEASGLPDQVVISDWSKSRRRPPRPMTLDVHISSGNTITLMSSAQRSTFWLSPDLIDFNSRLKVKLKSRLKWNDFVEPNIETMLEDFRTRGDRQKLYWARLDF